MLHSLKRNGDLHLVAGFECSEQLTATVGDRILIWTERRWVVRSLQHAAAATAALQKRLDYPVTLYTELAVNSAHPP